MRQMSHDYTITVEYFNKPCLVYDIHSGWTLNRMQAHLWKLYPNASGIKVKCI